jgi:pimeloyl-ACP methyl ester carboxylesterase
MSGDDTRFHDIFFTSRDGLTLHARRYPAVARGSKGRPVVCLPGLTRNGRDFHKLALELSGPAGNSRDVYTLDSRGRGQSQYDRDSKNYSVLVEMLDVIDFMTLEGLSGAALIGTSRGGLITMLLAAAQPGNIGCAVLNDIGPVIEHDGLLRISSYVGRTPLPISWQDAARMARELNQRHFPYISEDEWVEVARQLFEERNGRPAPGYDPALSNALSVLSGPVPELWPQFEALKSVPVLVVRGENSDVLSEATVDEMRRRHPALATITVANQGHAPLLRDGPTIESIRSFLLQTDAAQHAAPVARAIA